MGFQQDYQIGRIFVYWAIVFFGQFIEILGYFFPQYQLCINFDKKMVGLHFGRLFHKLVWSVTLDRTSAHCKFVLAQNFCRPIPVANPTIVSYVQRHG
jgi:hypothetical protein